MRAGNSQLNGTRRSRRLRSSGDQNAPAGPDEAGQRRDVPIGMLQRSREHDVRGPQRAGLEPFSTHLNVGEAEVEDFQLEESGSPRLRLDQTETCPGEGDGKHEAREAGPGSDVQPRLADHRTSGQREEQRVGRMPPEYIVQTSLGHETETISLASDRPGVRKDPRESAIGNLELVEKAGDDRARIHVSRET